VKISDFLKGKGLYIFSQLILVTFLLVLFTVLQTGSELSFYIVIVFVMMNSVVLAVEYFRKRSFYNELSSLLASVEQKYLISGMIKRPDFSEGQFFYDSMKQMTKSMNDAIAKYKTAQDEYYDYIESWIHEVKNPISCIELICENNRNEITKSIGEEVQKIDNYVEQALYYARSTHVEKDNMICNIHLDKFVKSVLKKHAKLLIANKANIRLSQLEFIVYSDPKWLNFILGQMISNSIKYKRDTLSLSFTAEEKEHYILLMIADQGIGIEKKDIGKVFDKGFTGENGHRHAKSTGMGLYLCKILCEKMNLKLDISSEAGHGTTLSITFPKDKSIMFQS
jgi:signal transduction histidine kinase